MLPHRVKVLFGVVVYQVCLTTVTTVVSPEHVGVHVDGTAVSDGVPQLLAHHLTGGVVGQPDLEEARLGGWEGIRGLHGTGCECVCVT